MTHQNDNDARRNQCVECANRHDNHDMICDACRPKGYGFTDDVDPASREGRA